VAFVECCLGKVDRKFSYKITLYFPEQTRDRLWLMQLMPAPAIIDMTHSPFA
jgi:hypothetical protein